MSGFDDLSCAGEETILSLSVSSSCSAGDMAGERKHFLKSIYLRHSEALVRYVRSLTGGNSGNTNAEDVVQTVFTRFSALDDPQNLENPQAYLYRSARNVVIDGARRESRERPVFVDSDELTEARDECDPERVELSREELRLIEKVLARMPPKRRKVFVLIRVHGLRYGEVAQELGISNAAVQKHMVRALAECRRALDGFTENTRDGKSQDEADG